MGAFFLILKRARYFLLVYCCFLVAVLIVLWRFNREESTVFINQFWSEGQDWFFSIITHLGDGVFGVLVIVFLLFRNVKEGLVALAAFLFTAGITQFLKHVIFDDVMRPYIVLWDDFVYGDLHLALARELMKKGNSFPSGHTTAAFTIFLLLTLFSKKSIYGLFYGVLAILAAYSRVYLSQHFVEDIFVGSLIGVFGTLFVYFSMSDKNKLV